MRTATPTVLVVAAYLVFYLAAGSGTAGQDAYLDPGHEPGAFR